MKKNPPHQTGVDRDSQPNGPLGTWPQTEAPLITSANFRLLSSNPLCPPCRSPSLLSCGDCFHSCRWNNILIRKQSPGRPQSFPLPAPLSLLEQSGEGTELTCCSDSLHCLRIIIWQLAVYRLRGIFATSGLGGDMNARAAGRRRRYPKTTGVSSPLHSFADLGQRCHRYEVRL